MAVGVYVLFLEQLGLSITITLQLYCTNSVLGIFIKIVSYYF